MAPPDPNQSRGRRRQDLSGVVRAHEKFDPAAANAEKVEKIRRNRLQRQARARGLEVRHSAYGYSLIDTARNRIGDRNDLTLDDVERQLDGAQG
jgi:hypothetical protein